MRLNVCVQERVPMDSRPSILFIALTQEEYVPSNVKRFGARYAFDLMPHKHAILALIAWLRQNNCDGHYIRLHPGDTDARSKISEKIDETKPDAVGFSLVTEELHIHYRVIQWLKYKYKNLPVIVGGPHVSAEPKHTLQNFPLIDYVCIGEGEATLTEWLRKIHEGRSTLEMHAISGLAFKDLSGDVVINESRPGFKDINILPDPAFDLIIDENFSRAVDTIFPLVSSYGCRFYCTFCGADHGNYRHFTPQRLAQQIQNAQENYGAKYFGIRDSTWPPSRKWLYEFIHEVSKRKLRFKFHFETRAGILDEDDFRMLKKIGLQAVAVGVESGDHGMLISMKKAITVDMAKRTFAALNNAGILSIAFFMFGNYGENRDSVKNTIKVINDLNPAILSISTMIPFPGTESFEHVPEKHKTWWMGMDGFPSICDFSVEELHRIRADVHIRYPIRWEYLNEHVFRQGLPLVIRKICYNIFAVHLRRYLLGKSEQSGVFRFAIRLLKRALNSNPTEMTDFKSENGY